MIRHSKQAPRFAIAYIEVEIDEREIECDKQTCASKVATELDALFAGARLVIKFGLSGNGIYCHYAGDIESREARRHYTESHDLITLCLDRVLDGLRGKE